MTRPDFDTLDPAGGDMLPVSVFYDCEFTDLAPDSALLSIGFVAADCDAELYIEIEDADVDLASAWVRATVLPQFGKHNPEVLARIDAARLVEAWLDDLRDGDRMQTVHLVSDSTWDWRFFVELLPLPSLNVSGRLISAMLTSGRQQQAFAEAQAAYFRQHGHRHHALVDARAAKAAWWDSRLS